MNSLWRRTWPCIVLGLLSLLTALLFAWACLFGNSVSFLVDWAPARWIIYPTPVFIELHHAVAMDTVFRRRLTLSSIPKEVRLGVRAFRACKIRINGRDVHVEWPSGDWKREHAVEITKYLRPGRNELEATVTNDSGPPALWLAVSSPETAEPLLTTNAQWEASLAGASWQMAALASVPRPFGGEDPYQIDARVIPSCAAVWPAWLVFGVLTAAVLAIGRHRFRRTEIQDSAMQESAATGRHEMDMLIPLALIGVAWAALFVHNSSYLSANHGFDAIHHLEYVHYVQTMKSLPLANQGWEMYHPPLYYLLSALLLTAGGYTLETGGLIVLRLLNLTLALCNIFTILACLRLIFPGQMRRQIFGLVFAAFLPMHLYVYQYPTNEVLATTLATAAIYFMLRILCDPDAKTRDYLLAGLALGAGALSKITVVALIPPVAMALIAHGWIDRRRHPWPRTLWRMILLGAIVFGVCGWHYARVWAHFGTPLVSNSDPGIGPPSWQDPGYRTSGEYVHFGQSLRSPLFSAWNGVWDGAYSTLWGDAECGGATTPEFRPPWSYDFMAAGFLLALLPTVAVVLGIVAAVWQFLRKPTILGAFLLTVAFAVVVFIACFTLRLAVYSAGKSFYLLPAVVPLCAFAAWGFDLLGGRRRWLQNIVGVLVGVWALNAYASYWVLPDRPLAQASRCIVLLSQGKKAEARTSSVAWRPKNRKTRPRDYCWPIFWFRRATPTRLDGCSNFCRAKTTRPSGTIFWERSLKANITRTTAAASSKSPPNSIRTIPRRRLGCIRTPCLAAASRLPRPWKRAATCCDSAPAQSRFRGKFTPTSPGSIVNSARSTRPPNTRSTFRGLRFPSESSASRFCGAAVSAAQGRRNACAISCLWTSAICPNTSESRRRCDSNARLERL